MLTPCRHCYYFYIVSTSPQCNFSHSSCCRCCCSCCFSSINICFLWYYIILFINSSVYVVLFASDVRCVVYEVTSLIKNVLRILHLFLLLYRICLSHIRRKKNGIFIIKTTQQSKIWSIDCPQQVFWTIHTVTGFIVTIFTSPLF